MNAQSCDSWRADVLRGKLCLMEAVAVVPPAAEGASVWWNRMCVSCDRCGSMMGVVLMSIVAAVRGKSTLQRGASGLRVLALALGGLARSTRRGRPGDQTSCLSSKGARSATFPSRRDLVGGELMLMKTCDLGARRRWPQHIEGALRDGLRTRHDGPNWSLD